MLKSFRHCVYVKADSRRESFRLSKSNFFLFLIASLWYIVAAQFVKQKLPDLLRSYVDADLGGSQEGGFQDIAIEALHLLLSHLLFGQKGSSGVGQEQIDAFLKTLCRGTQPSWLDQPREV